MMQLQSMLKLSICEIKATTNWRIKWSHSTLRSEIGKIIVWATIKYNECNKIRNSWSAQSGIYYSKFV